MIKIKSEIKEWFFDHGDTNEVEFEFFEKEEKLGCIKFTLEKTPAFLMPLVGTSSRKILNVTTTKSVDE